MANAPFTRVAAGCFALAVTLNLSFTEYATQYVTGYVGYSESIRGPLSEPILMTWWTEALVGCLRQDCQVGGFTSVSGFFAREAFPRDLAFWAGIVLPCALLTLSVFFAFGFHRLIALLLLLSGLGITGASGIEVFNGKHFWTHLFERYGTWQILPCLLLGIAFLSAGVWLWSNRTCKQTA